MINSIKDIQNLLKSGFTDWKSLGHVSVNEKGSLRIFNYNPRAQFEARWNFFEQVSRGLILDAITGEVIARPFDKFFNWGEGERYSDAPINTVTEKMDGCFLGNTKLNLWGGGTITIREVIRNRLPVELTGMDSDGNLVPTQVTGWFDNDTKDDWLLITINCNVSRLAGTRTGNHIPITPNHHIYLNGRYQPAMNAKKGDIVLNYESIPDDSTIHLFRSGLLGDGCLTHLCNAFRYQESHKDVEYTKAVIAWMGACAINSRCTISGYGTEMYWANSKAYKALAFLRKEWYPDGKKVVPEDLSWMDDFSVAKWYMDDGSLAHNDGQQDRALFATNGFSEQGVKRLADKLQDMYGVTCTVYFSKGYALRINAGRRCEIEKFWGKITPYIVPSMRYKVPEQYRSLPYIPYPGGSERRQALEVEVVEVRCLKDDNTHSYFASGRKGFDIKTTTGNYFIKGVLVHNSLGILYRDNGQFRIATRGSFESAQALWATEYLNKNFNLEVLPSGLTLLFEIIYPDNRVVVDYQGKEDLVLLAARNRVTGEYIPFFDHLKNLAEIYKFSLPKVYQFNTLDQITEAARFLDVNSEGWVVEFLDGQRFKFKGEEYRKLHKLISGLNFKNVLEHVSGGTLDQLLSIVPDEFLDEVHEWIDQIQSTVNQTKQQIEIVFNDAPKDTRKDFALWVMANYKELSPYLFARLDNKPVEPLIYKKAFNND